ncbi:MAG: hypothetical protein IJX81_03955 [Clostridia bacterium]|nr:hypothetical protein [Clostridia bacterium]
MKKKLTIIAMSVASVGIFAGAALALQKGNVATAEIFGKTNKVTVTRDAAAPDDAQGRKGILLSTTAGGASVEFDGEMSGVFAPEFRPYSKVAGVQDFGSLTFSFSSTETRLGFAVEFTSNANGVAMSYTLSNNTLLSKTVAVDGSFCNLDRQAIGFTFDPAQMTVANDKGVVIADMQDEGFMREFLCSETLESWSRYNVTVSFSKLSDNATANVLFYAVNGQEFAGAMLENTASAVIVKDPTFARGVVNKQYSLPMAMTSYDVLDGYRDEFTGTISVLDPFGEEVTVTDGAFTPAKTGEYRVTYTLRDQEGLLGESKEYAVRVLEAAPQGEICYELPLESNEIGVGSTIYLPKAYGYCELEEGALPVNVAVYKGNETLKAKSEAVGETFTFAEAGSYTVVYTLSMSTGDLIEEKKTVTVSNLPMAKLNVATQYAVGDVFTVPTARFEKEGVEYDATHTVVFPDGSSSAAENVTLEKSGTYSVVWRFEYQGKAYFRTAYFNAVDQVEDLFAATRGLTVTANYTAPAYADEAYNGVLLTARQAVSVEYANTFNIADNTADDVLVEFFVSPAEQGTMEFEQLDIYFYDVYDESNFIHIRFVDDPWLYYLFAMSVMGLTTDEADTTGNANFRKYYYSHFVYSSFYGKYSANGEYPAQSVKLYFDYESGKLYANTASSDNDLNRKVMNSSMLIADLKDESWVGAGNAFEKFTTGETRMVVKMSALKGESNMMLLTVDGQSLAGKTLLDDTTPDVFVDYDGNDAENIPLGEVGVEYKLYRAYLQDAASGYSENVTAEVYYVQGGAREKIRTYDGKFLPEKAGAYEILYTGSDPAGNIASRVVPVQIVSKGGIPPIEYTFGEMVDVLWQGETARFVQGEASGGTGKLYVDVKVLCGEQEIQLDENGCFKAALAGTYTIEVRVSDYNGTSDPFTYFIEVKETVKPLIYETTVNGVVRAGETVTLPAFEAVVYHGSVEEKVAVEYYVDGVKLPESREWTPAAGEDKAYVFTVKAGESEREYVINAVSPEKDEKGYAASFFYAEGGTLTAEKSGIKIATEPNGGCKVGFARMIDVNFLTFALSVKSENFSRLIVTLVDSVDPEERVEILIRKGVNAKGEENRAFLNVNGKEYEMRGEFYNSNIPLYVQYNAQNHSLSDDVSNPLGKIEYAENGNKFKGFSSGFVYVQFRVEETTDGESALWQIENVGGQKFSSTIKYDRTGPMIRIDGSWSEVNVGDMVTVYPATAFDLLSGVRSISVSVTLNGKALYENVPCDEAFDFRVEQYGTYVITYLAIDNIGEERPRPQSVIVVDRVPPTIQIEGDMPQAVRVNERYTLPTATVTDDYSDVILYVYAIAPNGEMVRLINYQFTPTVTGKYKIVYMAKDGAGSSTIKTFDVWVVE